MGSKNEEIVYRHFWVRKKMGRCVELHIFTSGLTTLEKFQWPYFDKIVVKISLYANLKSLVDTEKIFEFFALKK